MKPKKTARHTRARAAFRTKGQSIAEWARLHKVGTSLVYEVLSGRKPCERGASHRIAVLLGIKDGDITDGPEAVTTHFRTTKETA